MKISKIPTCSKIRTFYLDISDPKQLKRTNRPLRVSSTLHTKKPPLRSHTSKRTLSNGTFATTQMNSHLSSKSPPRASPEKSYTIRQKGPHFKPQRNSPLRPFSLETAEKPPEFFTTTYEALKRAEDFPLINISDVLKKQIFLKKPKTHSSKNTLIFDLDETLVHSVDKDTKDKDATVSITLPGGTTEEIGLKLRPYAAYCLKTVSQLFEIIIFTASQQCYADQAIALLDPHKEYVHHRVYRESCLEVSGCFVKDLRIFMGRRLERLALIDNNCLSFAYQLGNGIPIPSWYGDQSDKELLHLLPYLHVLAQSENIPEDNQKTFKLYRFCSDFAENPSRCTLDTDSSK